METLVDTDVNMSSPSGTSVKKKNTSTVLVWQYAAELCGSGHRNAFTQRLFLDLSACTHKSLDQGYDEFPQVAYKCKRTSFSMENKFADYMKKVPLSTRNKII